MKVVLILSIFTVFGIVLNSSKADRAEEYYSFFPNQKYKSNFGVNTDALIIKVGEKKIIEEYNRGYTKDSKHLSWSVAKTIAGILVAQAIEQGVRDEKFILYVFSYFVVFGYILCGRKTRNRPH